MREPDSGIPADTEDDTQMVELNVTQAEADALIAMPKVRANEGVWNFPGPGGSVSVPLLSENKRENFLLDVSRGQINLSRLPTRTGHGRLSSLSGLMSMAHPITIRTGKG